VNESADQREIIRKLVALQYKRNDQAFARGNFRVRGDNLEIFPSHYEDMAWRINFFGDEIEGIVEFDPLTGKKIAAQDYVSGRPPRAPAHGQPHLPQEEGLLAPAHSSRSHLARNPAC